MVSASNETSVNQNRVREEMYEDRIRTSTLTYLFGAIFESTITWIKVKTKSVVEVPLYAP